MLTAEFFTEHAIKVLKVDPKIVVSERNVIKCTAYLEKSCCSKKILHFLRIQNFFFFFSCWMPNSAHD